MFLTDDVVNDELLVPGNPKPNLNSRILDWALEYHTLILFLRGTIRK